MDAGADLGGLCEKIYQSYPITRVRLLRHVYSKFRMTHGDRTAYFWLRKADYARAGADSEESEGLIDHIRAIEGVVVAIMFEEMGADMVRLSIRSKNPSIDVGAVAALFGGGGHRSAAGARIPGTALSVQRRVLAAVRRSLAA